MCIRDRVRDEGPKTHLEKSGTPTFGGLFFLIPLVLFAIVMLFVLDEARDVCVIVLFMVLFGSVGFVDDYIKVHISKEGLSVRQKTVFLAAVSIAASVYTVWFSDSGSLFLLPFATPVSYTHLDVYKRQVWSSLKNSFTVWDMGNESLFPYSKHK